MDNRPIGVFDSGVGGLTVVSQLIKQLPNEKIVYFGDTARVPYGTKTKQTITKFSKQIVRFLLTKDVKLIVVACGTVSSNCLDELKQAFDETIIGVVEEGARDAAAKTKNNIIGVIGTERTVKSNTYKNLIVSHNQAATVYETACPLFVPLAEEGWTDNQVALLTAKTYLEPLLKSNIDTLVLGCTHYPLLKSCIKQTVGEGVKLVDPAKKTAQKIKAILEQRDALADTKSAHEFFVSDKTQGFEAICKQVLKSKYEPQLVDIEKY